jgi:hypothetical protein
MCTIETPETPTSTIAVAKVSGGSYSLVIPKYNLGVAKMYNKRYNYGSDNYLHYLREFGNLVADTFKE